MSAWKAKCSNVLSYCEFKANKKYRRHVVNIATIQSMDAGLRAVENSVWKEVKKIKAARMAEPKVCLQGYKRLPQTRLG
jgi:hypothetical protein